MELYSRLFHAGRGEGVGDGCEVGEINDFWWSSTALAIAFHFDLLAMFHGKILELRITNIVKFCEFLNLAKCAVDLFVKFCGTPFSVSWYTV